MSTVGRFLLSVVDFSANLENCTWTHTQVFIAFLDIPVIKKQLKLFSDAISVNLGQQLSFFNDSFHILLILK